MSPRIQVYKAIACRALSTDSPGIHDLASYATDCGDAEVQARAAKIQAGTSRNFRYMRVIESFVSCRDHNECPQCHLNGFLE